MKKIIYVLIASYLLLTFFSVTSFALDYEYSPTNDDACYYTNEQYGYKYEENVDENGKIIRTYTKGNVYQSSSSTYSLNRNNIDVNDEYTKSLLSDMGMGDDFINQLSDEMIELYSKAENIICITTYTKTDKNGQVILVDEMTAFNGISKNNITIDNKINFDSYNVMVVEPPVPVIDPDIGAGSGSTRYSNSITDQYMRIVFTVTEMDGGYYHYAVDSEWLTMPFFRGYDSVGACAMGNAINNSTRSGWCSYDYMYTSGGVTNTYHIKNDFSSNSFQNDTNDGWYGSGVIFNLPNDTESISYDGLSSSSQIYFNYKVHYEFQGVVNNPTLETYFNATATYSHSTIGISGSPSLEISTSGVSMSIGLDLMLAQQDVRIVELDSPIHYLP